MGCGTGILGIIALKRGAGSLTAIDIDPWAYENVQENASLNNISIDEIICGDASTLEGKAPYDLILANITRNILLEDMPRYTAVMHSGSRLLLSGFYEEDIPLLVETGDPSSFEGVVVVRTPLATRLQRLVSSRGMSEEDARARITAQATDEQREAIATWIIDNGGSLEETAEQVRTVWAQMIAA